MLSQYSRRFLSVILLFMAGFLFSASQADAAFTLIDFRISNAI